MYGGCVLQFVAAAIKKALGSSVFVTTCLLLQASNTYAEVSPGTSQDVVCVYHAMISPSVAKLGDDSEAQSLGEFANGRTPTVRLDPGDSVTVRVCDYNPVLFVYAIGEVKEDVPDLAAATAFANAIQTVSGALAGKSAGEDLEINGLSIEELRAAVDDVNARVALIPDLAEDTTRLGTDALREKQKAVAGWSSNVKRLQPSLSKVEAIDAATAGTAKLTVTNPKTGQPFPNVSSLDDVKDHLRAAFSDRASQDRLLGLLSQVNYLQLVTRRLSDIRASLNTLNAFIEAYAKINDPDKSPQLTVTYSTTSIVKVNVTVTSNPAFTSLLNDKTKNFQKDKATATNTPLTVKAVPNERMELSIAPGVIYSFVRQTKYVAKTNPAGGFTIAGDESDYAAVSGAVVLNITPREYVGRGKQFFGQVGIAPEGGKIAFLLGAGMTLYDRAVFSVGVIYQERDVLAQGLKVGAPLASQDDLKVDQEFKFGAYVGLSFNLASSGNKEK